MEPRPTAQSLLKYINKNNDTIYLNILIWKNNAAFFEMKKTQQILHFPSISQELKMTQSASVNITNALTWTVFIKACQMDTNMRTEVSGLSDPSVKFIALSQTIQVDAYGVLGAFMIGLIM